jgi:dTMP kinase
MTLILDLPVGEGLMRAAARAGAADRFERLDDSFHERLRAGFQAIATAEPRRCLLIDARGSIDEVHDKIVAAITQRFEVTLG